VTGATNAQEGWNVELGLKGKRAIVLAASRGLGYACALGLAREGCDLVVCSRDEGRIQEAAARLRKESGARVLPLAVDVSQPDAAPRIVAACVETYGGLEVAVHNAGGPPAGDTQSISDAQWHAAFDANLLSLARLARAAAPAMKKANYGRILTIASSSIRQPIPNLVLSNALRAGVLGLAKTLSRELAADGILVNVIAPGRIATERLDELDEAVARKTGQSTADVRRASVATVPLGRLGEPRELANLAVFLASEAASYITGAAVQVDGGLINAL
jgi:3-oxoacyl-[acyl-carrier protein] reductase